MSSSEIVGCFGGSTPQFAGSEISAFQFGDYSSIAVTTHHVLPRSAPGYFAAAMLLETAN
ncbi:MAG TPA: hypothetical protein VM099_04020 [Gemmatimonadaceae bacterium]|nr:hypothetical protein [Gemmatimonadaceae bacterium]